MAEILLKIIVNEQQREKRDTTCKKILTYLWEKGVPGATMRRGEAGLDFQGNINYDLLEDTYFNDLPILIESVMDKEKGTEIEGGLNQMIVHGQISRIEGIRESDMKTHSHFSPGEHLPLIIECIADREHLPLLLNELKMVVNEGAVFTAPVDLILNK